MGSDEGAETLEPLVLMRKPALLYEFEVTYERAKTLTATVVAATAEQAQAMVEAEFKHENAVVVDVKHVGVADAAVEPVIVDDGR